MAVDLTRPDGRVLGVDLIPTQPPEGVSTIQGNFLSPKVQDFIKKFLHDQNRGRSSSDNLKSEQSSTPATDNGQEDSLTSSECKDGEDAEQANVAEKPYDQSDDRTVDVVLSDMFVTPTSGNTISQI